MKGICLNILVLIVLYSCSETPVIPDNVGDMTDKENNLYGLDNDDLPLLGELRVMTYNIHAANPPTEAGLTDIYGIAQVISQADPHIVLLQEVDKNTGRNNYHGDQSKELGKLTGMNHQYYSAIPFMNGHYGIAILSKFPLYNPEKHLLPKLPGLEQRVLGTAVVDLPGVDSVLIACTHLQHNDANNRVDQIREICNILSLEEVPVIIGGDFNEKPGSNDFFNVFDKTFTRTCLSYDCPFTFSTKNPSAVIDYIGYKPESGFEVLSHATWPENHASDHFPVIVNFKLIR